MTLTIMSPQAVFISPFWLMHANLMNVSHLEKKAFVSGQRENNSVSQECVKLGHLIAAGEKRSDPVRRAHEERTTSFIRRAPQLLTVQQLFRMFR